MTAKPAKTVSLIFGVGLASKKERVISRGDTSEEENGCLQGHEPVFMLPGLLQHVLLEGRPARAPAGWLRRKGESERERVRERARERARGSAGKKESERASDSEEHVGPLQPSQRPHDCRTCCRRGAFAFCSACAHTSSSVRASRQAWWAKRTARTCAIVWKPTSGNLLLILAFCIPLNMVAREKQRELSGPMPLSGSLPLAICLTY